MGKDGFGNACWRECETINEIAYCGDKICAKIKAGDRPPPNGTIVKMPKVVN
ncbi:hypothetical protein [Bradyrhizobium sp.]|uniref:hypothetical protein n=1 Tax=Bradyrhizobium sp. TaxID=376 RepID=UPI002735110B|nr:hypothetical protein [Bradyrhizobium sp.]